MEAEEAEVCQTIEDHLEAAESALEDASWHIREAIKTEAARNNLRLKVSLEIMKSRIDVIAGQREKPHHHETLGGLRFLSRSKP